MERITDIALLQGPILRLFGIWTMQIQTAGTGVECEGVLYGVRNPEQARDLILSQRFGGKDSHAEKPSDGT